MAKTELRHIITKDGSSTLYAPQYDEHYHSLHGAIQESMHVFIDAGFRPVSEQKDEISILEMGFGTGLNALLTYLWRGNRRIFYTSLEASPVPVDQVLALNYPEALGEDELKPVFAQMHQTAWDKPVAISDQFQLHKVHTRLQDFVPDQQFDLIYFDAFAPSAQPELWEPEIMLKLYQCLRPGGVFVTYSAKGTVRRGLISAGFDVEKIPGPPGKREMLRGVKSIP